MASGSTSTTSWAKVSGEPRLVTPPARTGDSPTSSIGVRPVKLTPAQRDQIAVDAAARYRAGESWAQIGADYGITGAYTYRLTTARHDITFRRWGQQPVADVDDVLRRRQDGQSLDQIAEALGCSRQAVRTALETTGGVSSTRYPRLAGRRLPTDAEIAELRRLYELCPQAPRARPGSRNVRGDEGRALAQACRELVDDGIPMATLSQAMGRSPTWVHWLLSIHDLRPDPHPVSTTSRRSRTPPP